MVPPPVDERERRAHPPEQLLGPERLEIVIGQTPQEHLGEGADRVAAIGRNGGHDLGEEGLKHRRRRFGLRGERWLGGGGGFGSGLGHVRAPRSVA